MPLVHLRTQMLIAMGLPACWTGAPPPPQSQAQPPVAVRHDFDGATCVRDSIPETVCGERRETARTCGTHGSNLGTVDELRLYVTAGDVDTPASSYRTFVFDRDATRKYRDDLDPDSRTSSCCYSQCTAMTVGPGDPVTLTGGRTLGTKCMPVPPNGTSRPAKDDPACPEGVLIDGGMRPYVSTEDGECCYSIPIEFRVHAIPGRALRVDGVPRVAEVADGRDGWTVAIAPDLALDAATREQLAAAWLAIARLEHASVAAFSALALRLLAAGAPPALIAEAHRAALDEVRHAQLAFALASAYAGNQLGPGAFEAATRAVTSGGLRALALETFADGCVGETVAAHQAELAAAAARDPEVAAALAAIAEDEARHGALAWAIVAWCVRQGAVTVAELAALAAVEPVAGAELPDELAVHGVLGARAAERARRVVLRDVVEPCLAALAA